jgi:menaquinone-dependent protoporphyrinogen oxidase
MQVLVAVASKHDATHEIALTVSRTLEDAGLDVFVRRPEEVESVEPYRAIVLGSAVYAGRWLEPARAFVERHGDALAGRPVWLFSSGPIGDPPKPEAAPTDVATILERTRARGHRVFPGRLDRRRLSLAEKVVVTAVRAQEGDFRPWDEVVEWAAGIAAELAAAGRAVAVPGGAA